MNDQPLYPYRDTNSESQQTLPNQPPPSQQSPYGDSGQQPQYQLQQPQPGVYQPNMPQGHAMMPNQWGQPNGQAGTWYGMQVPVTNALATASLVCGISATVFALLGYILPTVGMLIAQTVLATLTVIMGLVGMRRGKLMGLKFGQALGGTILGAFSIVLFCILATSQVGSMEALISGAGNEDVPTIDDSGSPDDPDDPNGNIGLVAISPDQVRQVLASSNWQGYVSADENEDSVFDVKFTTEQSNFSWSDENFGINGSVKHAQGSISMLFGNDAIERAKAEGYDFAVFGGEEEIGRLQEYGSMPICLEFNPSDSDSTFLPLGTKTLWFGYAEMFSDGSGNTETWLSIARKTDSRLHLFLQEL